MQDSCTSVIFTLPYSYCRVNNKNHSVNLTSDHECDMMFSLCDSLFKLLNIHFPTLCLLRIFKQYDVYIRYETLDIRQAIIEQEDT